LHAQNPALSEEKNHMNHIFDAEDEEQSSTPLKFLKTLIDKLIKERKHPTAAPLSSGMTNSFVKIHFLAMKKMKNSHPHVPHVQPVGQNPKAPFPHGIHKGENTQRLLRHHLGRPTPFMVSLRTTLRIQIQTYIILCLRTVWRQSENKIKKTTRSTRCTRTTRTTGQTGVPPPGSVERVKVFPLPWGRGYR
jgi:hypothetical protein